MPRFRSRSSLSPINRIKHVFDQQLGLVLNVQTQINLATSVDAPTVANTDGVAVGSKINGIYLHIEAAATTAGALANIYMGLAKNPGNNLTFPKMNVVGGDENKKYIMHQEMVMLEKSVNGNPRTVFNGVIVIPRGYRRMGPSDTIKLLLFAPGVNCDVCLQAHYKEFR